MQFKTIIVGLGAAAVLAACETTGAETAQLEVPIETAVTESAEGSSESGEIFVAFVPLAGAPDQKICRVRPVTGSRVKTEKRCFTRREWAEISSANQRFIQGTLASQPHSAR